uniref:HTH CENPB-type domain-containing protein n=1 Tax=Gadus morhua TaxID=8049 RepID=A0A8C4ZMM1_GADMO
MCYKSSLRVVAAAKGSSNRAAAREFGVDESQVRRWRASEETLGRQKGTARAVGRGQKCRWPELEQRVAEWVRAQRVAGRAVSTVGIRLTSGVVAHDMGLTGFKASPSWCTRFMRRNGLSARARTAAGQKLPGAWEETVQEHDGYVHRVIQENNFPASKVGNMDTVAMSFDFVLQTIFSEYKVVRYCYCMCKCALFVWIIL